MSKSRQTKIKQASASTQSGISQAGPQQQDIALAAYYRAHERGFAPGRELHDWLEAEREITGDQTDASH